MLSLERPIIKNLLVRRGTTFRRRISLKAQGQPYDLTGCKAISQIKREYEADEVLAEFSFIWDFLEGLITFELPTAETLKLPPNILPSERIPRRFDNLPLGKLPPSRYVWDLDLIFPTDDVVTIYEGGILVRPEVSRWTT